MTKRSQCPFPLNVNWGPEMLENLFPSGGFGEVFGQLGAQGKVKLAGGWKRGALELDVLEGSLSTTSGERQLHAQGLGPLRVSFHNGKPRLAAIEETDADLLQLSVKKFPVDGLLNWRSGRFQGTCLKGTARFFSRTVDLDSVQIGSKWIMDASFKIQRWWGKT